MTCSRNCSLAPMTSGLGYSQILGYDLGLQQRVAVVTYPTAVPEDRVFHGVRRAAQNLGARPLLGSRRSTVVVLAEASLSWHSLRAETNAELGRVDCHIGVGGVCDHATDVPRSYREAQLALQFMSYGDRKAAVVSFDDLGVFQILAEARDPNTVQRFVRNWLGALLDYGASRSGACATLSTYLETGGNYAHSARVLNIHRNTLRYRLKRIRSLRPRSCRTRRSVQPPACRRAWRTLAAIDTVENHCRRWISRSWSLRPVRDVEGDALSGDPNLRSRRVGSPAADCSCSRAGRLTPGRFYALRSPERKAPRLEPI